MPANITLNSATGAILCQRCGSSELIGGETLSEIGAAAERQGWGTAREGTSPFYNYYFLCPACRRQVEEMGCEPLAGTLPDFLHP